MKIAAILFTIGLALFSGSSSFGAELEKSISGSFEADPSDRLKDFQRVYEICRDKYLPNIPPPSGVRLFDVGYVYENGKKVIRYTCFDPFVQ